MRAASILAALLSLTAASGCRVILDNSLEKGGPGGDGGVGPGPITLFDGYDQTLSGDNTGGPGFAAPTGGACPTSMTREPTVHREFVLVGAPSTDLSVTVGMSSVFDAYLVVYEGHGIPEDTSQCLTFDDDGGEGRNSLVTFTLRAGARATVVATAFNATDEGTFTLRIQGAGT